MHKVLIRPIHCKFPILHRIQLLQLNTQCTCPFAVKFLPNHLCNRKLIQKLQKLFKNTHNLIHNVILLLFDNHIHTYILYHFILHNATFSIYLYHHHYVSVFYHPSNVLFHIHNVPFDIHPYHRGHAIVDETFELLYVHLKYQHYLPLHLK